MLKGEGDNGIIISEKCFPLHDARVYQCSYPVTESSEEEKDWDDSNESMLECSEPGCVKSFQIFSKLESHLDVVDHCLKDERPSETLYDRLRRDWADRFTTSVNVTEDEPSEPNIL